MLPTFDFHNILALLARVILNTFKSPITILALFTASIVFYCADFKTLFSFDEWVSLHIDTILQPLEGNPFVNTMFYMFNVEAFVTYFSASWHFLARVIPAILAFYGTFFFSVLAYKASHALRATVKDVIG